MFHFYAQGGGKLTPLLSLEEPAAWLVGAVGTRACLRPCLRPGVGVVWLDAKI